jgi:hypothetical protein
MAYSQGGLIQATDYNTFIGTSPSSTVNTINTVWAVGSGSAGYGQSALSSVSVGSVITATQWASLINTLNSIRTHQTGSGSGISATTAGSKIDYLSTLSTQITNGYNGRLSFASNSAVSTSVGGSLSTAWSVAVADAGSNPPASATSLTTLSRAFGVRCAFASADQARYFFNAGGRLKLNCSGTQNASTTARTNEVISMLGFLGGVATFNANTNGGRTGTGGTLGTNDTAKGYYTATYNANVTLVAITSTTTNYTTDTASIAVSTTGTKGSNNDNGLNVDFWITLSTTSGTPAPQFGFNDSIGVNVIRTIDVSYPETTNISNTWGTVTVSAL